MCDYSKTGNIKNKYCVDEEYQLFGNIGRVGAGIGIRGRDCFVDGMNTIENGFIVGFMDNNCKKVIGYDYNSNNELFKQLQEAYMV